jgi:hypothetical protein
VECIAGVARRLHQSAGQPVVVKNVAPVLEPELRRRGLRPAGPTAEAAGAAETAGTAPTLRERLGLPRPPSRYAAA